MSSEEIVEFNGKKINCSRLTDESLIRLYKNMREKEVSLYEKIINYQEKLGIEDEEVNEMLNAFENSLK